MFVHDGCSSRRRSLADDLRERHGTLDVILDHKDAGSVDSSSLYVIEATLYSLLDRKPVKLL